MSNQPNPNADPTWTLLLFAAVLVFFGFLGWLMLRVPFLEVLRYLRLAELGVIGLFTNAQDACFTWLRYASVTPEDATAEGAQRALDCFGNFGALKGGQPMDYYLLTGHSIGNIGHRVSYYLHVPITIAAILVAIYVIFFSPKNHFKVRHNLESFIRVQAKMWPVIRPIVDFKPANVSARIFGTPLPDKLPPFAEALSPEEWIAWSRVPVVNGIPDREAARRSFITQLGPRWQGIDGLPPYMRALLMAFGLKGVQKREESDEMLGKLSSCWTLQKGFHMPPDLAAEIDKLARDKEIGGEVTRIGAQHAYRTTAILGVLKWARSMGGVLASAQFLWLRAVDRPLWYPLNNLGRRSFHVEGSGAMAHFMAEQNAKKPLPIPRVDTATVAINQFLNDPDKHPQPIPPREEPNKA